MVCTSQQDSDSQGDGFVACLPTVRVRAFCACSCCGLQDEDDNDKRKKKVRSIFIDYEAEDDDGDEEDEPEASCHAFIAFVLTSRNKSFGHLGPLFDQQAL